MVKYYFQRLRALFYHSGKKTETPTPNEKTIDYERLQNTIVMMKAILHNNGIDDPCPALLSPLFDRETTGLSETDKETIRTAMTEIIFLTAMTLPDAMTPEEIEARALSDIMAISARAIQGQPIYGMSLTIQ